MMGGVSYARGFDGHRRERLVEVDRRKEDWREIWRKSGCEYNEWRRLLDGETSGDCNKW